MCVGGPISRWVYGKREEKKKEDDWFNFIQNMNLLTVLQSMGLEIEQRHDCTLA